MYYIQKNIKKSYKNNKFELPEGSCSVSDIQDYFDYITKKHQTVTNSPAIRIHVNKIESRITFKIKTGYYLQLLTPETMKLLGSTNIKKIKDENGENVPHLEFNEVVLVHSNIVNNDFQQGSTVLYTFAPNKLFG